MAKFRTRARTLDMLGRQQIAGIPTAISELFKNAHDAYAHHAEIDYYRSKNLFVLRDDGIGMTKKDFTDRWLSIGTESKVDSPSMKLPSEYTGRQKRVILGEKGIGRLAVARIGPQVLILTRARMENKVSSITTALINWRIFECPGIDLEEVDIPIRSYSGGKLPSAADVIDMVGSVEDNLSNLKSRISNEQYIKIQNEIWNFKIDPEDIDSRLGSPSLRNKGTGTHFIIKPSDDLLSEDIDGGFSERSSKEAPLLTKFLLGFTNNISSEHRSEIHVAFRDHDSTSEEKDILADQNFFTDEDFEEADHHFMGKFDEYGDFTGAISIFGQKIENHPVRWDDKTRKKTLCGPFAISLAAIERDRDSTRMPPEVYARISQKMEKIGGLYIYRNGIRILPYGVTDFDWLGIELRRSKGAGYYYFSHRKMFGAVEIDVKINSELREKAGREGFQNNKAYREFRNILINFFLQVTADFLRSSGKHSDPFTEQKREKEKLDSDRRSRKRKTSKIERKFGEDMNSFFVNVSNGEPEKKVLALQEKVSKKLKLIGDHPRSRHVIEKIMNIEKDAQEELSAIKSKYEIERPKIGVSKNIDRDWRDYKVKASSLSEDIFRPARQSIEEKASELINQANIAVDIQEYADKIIQDSKSNALIKIEHIKYRLDEQIERIATESSKVIEAFHDKLQAIEDEFQGAAYSDQEDYDIFEIRDILESKILMAVDECSDKLDNIQSSLVSIALDDESSILDVLVAVEQRNIHLEDEIETDLQLAQIGMAIEILNHEFNTNVRSIRNILRNLRDSIGEDDNLASLYKQLRINFDHLDEYLTLFTPLHKRLYRKEVDILGSSIYKFLRDLFRERLERHNIKLVRTKQFSRSKKKGYPSSFYPVFINLVDNAIFWLSEQNPSKERLIRLHEKNDSWIVMDTGPNIDNRNRELVFDYGFTMKPGGRGLGLYISREILRRIGYDINIIDMDGVAGAVFAIQPIVNNDGGGE